MVLRRRAVGIAVAAIVLAVIAKAATFLFVVKSVHRGCGDPLDRFRVLEVAGAGDRSIVTVDYENADSAARVLAFWIVSGDPPVVGSEDKVCGSPIAVWVGPRAGIQVSWSPAGQPVLAPAAKPSRVVAGPFMTACYLAQATLCYDAGRASLERAHD